MQKTSVGTMMFNPKDSTAGKSIDLYGEYMRDELELLKQVVRVGDYIVDAGAMYGGTALGLSKVVGDKGAVYSFEPQRVLHQILCSNFAMNGVFHAHCRHEALGASEGEVVVPALDVTKEGCHGCTTIDPTNYLGETVKMITVDSMNLLKLRLLKADVEGMELDIVKGAVKTINMFKPALYLRAHYTPEDNTLSPKTQELARYVQSLNYDMYWHFARLYQEDNFYGNKNNVFGDETLLYILAVPHVDGSTIEGLEPVVVPPA
jgi:FkbM family methyltransferase